VLGAQAAWRGPISAVEQATNPRRAGIAGRIGAGRVASSHTSAV
jgi:hypothetical protein